jgi:FkbM family methyltransferase
MSLLDLSHPSLLLAKLARPVCRRWPSPRLRMWVRNRYRRWCTDEELVTDTRWGFRMRVSPRDYASYGVYFFGEYDERMSHVMSRYIHSGHTAWDIGAERGWFTLLMAKLVGPCGRVDAFEAFPDNARKLRENVYLNNMMWARVISAAVGEASGEAWFVPPSDDITGRAFLRNCGGVGYLTAQGRPGAIRVPTITLDDYGASAGIQRVDFIKLDIEGAEVDALRGAADVIQRFQPILAVEYNRSVLHRAGHSTRELDDLLDRYGYDRYAYRDGFHPLTLDGWEDKPEIEAVLNVYCFPRAREFDLP